MLSTVHSISTSSRYLSEVSKWKRKKKLDQMSALKENPILKHSFLSSVSNRHWTKTYSQQSVWSPWLYENEVISSARTRLVIGSEKNATSQIKETVWKVLATSWSSVCLRPEYCIKERIRDIAFSTPAPVWSWRHIIHWSPFIQDDPSTLQTHCYEVATQGGMKLWENLQRPCEEKHSFC